MLASTNTKENFDEENSIEVDKFGIHRVVKSVAIFGANGSGKTNFATSLMVFKKLILDSLNHIEAGLFHIAPPFMLKQDLFDIPTEFEATFLCNDILYRYGLSFNNTEILEEWLYWTRTKRETQLFHRQNQNIEINGRSFSEAKDFIKTVDGKKEVDKTKSFIPFISVLSQFDGKISNQITKWFKRLNIVSGIHEKRFSSYTINQFEKNEKFRSWARPILNSVQIEDIQISEQDRNFTVKESVDNELDEIGKRLNSYIIKNNPKEKIIEVLKKIPDSNEMVAMPLSYESDGTQKLIYFLAPLYDTIMNRGITIIDEFDSKFHTILTRFLIQLFHKMSNSGSQLIMSCHDTNLLSKEIFRRDQIWFVDKNEGNQSELYSLLEYKEYYARKEGSYSKDYLAGNFGAIPLLSSIDQLSDI